MPDMQIIQDEGYWPAFDWPSGLKSQLEKAHEIAQTDILSKK